MAVQALIRSLEKKRNKMESLETAHTVLYSVIPPFTQLVTIQSAWCHRTCHLFGDDASCKLFKTQTESWAQSIQNQSLVLILDREFPLKNVLAKSNILFTVNKGFSLSFSKWKFTFLNCSPQRIPFIKYIFDSSSPERACFSGGHCMVQDQGRACTFEFMCVWVAGLVSEWNSMGEEGEEEGGNE